jgi:hypothetical protein
MDRDDVCILINSTPRYFSMLSLQLLLLRRYAPKLHWKVFFATEEPEHEEIVALQKTYAIEILPLSQDEKGFLESREAALRKIPKQYTYVLPLQEDFLLDREPMYDKLAEACRILDMDRTVASLRLMPCPGPMEKDPYYHPDMNWKVLTDDDTMTFTYQATLWRTYDLHSYYKTLLTSIEKDFPSAVTAEQKKTIALKMNCAETQYGQSKLRSNPNLLHLAWNRAGPWANAVYLSPFPYRPTAIVQGKVEAFAIELSKREGFSQSFTLDD